MMRELHGEALNLTYEVRDGVVCHCGEQYDRIVKSSAILYHNQPASFSPHEFLSTLLDSA